MKKMIFIRLNLKWNLAIGFKFILRFDDRWSNCNRFLAQIMYFVDEGCRMLDLHKESAGKRAFETLILSCLELLNKALEIQPKFMNLLSLSNSDRILTPLHQLLIGINARTGNPDHLLNIAKWVVTEL